MGRRSKGEGRPLLKTILCILAIVVIAGALYLYGIFLYRDKERFMNGTKLCGVYDVSNMTAREAQEKIAQDIESYSLTVRFRGGSKETITSKDIDFIYRPGDSIEKALQEQDLRKWPVAALFGLDQDISLNASYSTPELESLVASFKEVQPENMTAPADARVEYRDGKFQIAAEKEGTQLDESLVLEAVQKAIGRHMSELDLNSVSGIYQEPAVRSDDAGLAKQVTELEKLAGGSVTYDMPGGTRVILDGNTTKDWLGTDENGDYYRDDALWNRHIREYVAAFAENYDTAGKGHSFTTTDGETVTVPGNDSYGYSLDQEEEAAQLAKDLSGNGTVEREPLWKSRELADPDVHDGFGNSYCEIDLTNQHMWVYSNGRLVADTDIVSGINDESHRTPAGIYFVSAKKKTAHPKKKRQQDGSYGSHKTVRYWIQFSDSGLGMMEASWRYNFGGNIYKYNGSNGCIDLPASAAQTVYDSVSEKMPVIIYTR